MSKIVIKEHKMNKSIIFVLLVFIASCAEKDTIEKLTKNQKQIEKNLLYKISEASKGSYQCVGQLKVPKKSKLFNDYYKLGLPYNKVVNGQIAIEIPYNFDFDIVESKDIGAKSENTNLNQYMVRITSVGTFSPYEKMEILPVNFSVKQEEYHGESYIKIGKFEAVPYSGDGFIKKREILHDITLEETCIHKNKANVQSINGLKVELTESRSLYWKKINVLKGDVKSKIQEDKIEDKLSKILECKDWKNAGPPAGTDIDEVTLEGLSLSKINLQSIPGLLINEGYSEAGSLIRKIQFPFEIPVFGHNISEVELLLGEGMAEQTVELKIDSKNLKQFIESSLGITLNNSDTGYGYKFKENSRYLIVNQGENISDSSLTCGYGF
jgi:hypothetical protein